MRREVIRVTDTVSWCVLRGLHSGTMYYIKLRAQTGRGMGLSTQIISVTTNGYQWQPANRVQGKLHCLLSEIILTHFTELSVFLFFL